MKAFKWRDSCRLLWYRNSHFFFFQYENKVIPPIPSLILLQIWNLLPFCPVNFTSVFRQHITAVQLAGVVCKKYLFQPFFFFHCMRSCVFARHLLKTKNNFYYFFFFPAGHKQNLKDRKWSGRERITFSIFADNAFLYIFLLHTPALSRGHFIFVLLDDQLATTD